MPRFDDAFGVFHNLQAKEFFAGREHFQYHYLFFRLKHNTSLENVRHALACRVFIVSGRATWLKHVGHDDSFQTVKSGRLQIVNLSLTNRKPKIKTNAYEGSAGVLAGKRVVQFRSIPGERTGAMFAISVKQRVMGGVFAPGGAQWQARTPVPLDLRFGVGFAKIGEPLRPRERLGYAGERM